MQRLTKIVLLILLTLNSIDAFAEGKKFAVDDKGNEYEIIPFELNKPSIIDEQILTEEEQKQVMDALRSEPEIDPEKKTFKEGRYLIGANLTPAKNDYLDDKHRGTVYFNPEKGNQFAGPNELKVRNYSFHKVIISDGTTVENANFAQAESHTPAIQGNNLTFINCNLLNVELDSSWTIIGGLTGHQRFKEIIENGKTFEVIEREINGQFQEISRRDITPELTP
jgi:hypothetical protein